jgi:hypothetical protein
MAVAVFERASEMLGWLISKKVPSRNGAFGRSNWQKWTLSALLFGLRIREVYSDFLSVEDGPAGEKKLAETLRKQLKNPTIQKTSIPPLALKGLDTGENPPNLADLVLRFLEAEASENDIELAGGIGRVA